MKLTFLGAAGEVTGSCYLVDTGEIRFLIDCGMFQGDRQAGQRNRRFGFDPRDIAFVLLSHAHIDHSGLLPRLVVQGFMGAVYATRPTCSASCCPTPIESADVLLVESTYGDRNHKSLVQTLDEFVYALNDTLSSRKGWNAQVLSPGQRSTAFLTRH